ncbi:hypothetical protein B0H12DRAFT_1101552 [Mycena haematopus]|nr:hypothetical protein B0H12DRAFT_1101552 [Mycena haematopus]
MTCPANPKNSRDKECRRLRARMSCLSSGRTSHPAVLTAAFTRFVHWPKTSRATSGKSARMMRWVSWAQGTMMGSAFEQVSKLNFRRRGTVLNDGKVVGLSSPRFPRYISSRLSSLHSASWLITEGDVYPRM